MLLFAIVLSSLMLTIIFTVGISYYHSYREQTARMAGSAYDAMLNEPTETQIRKSKDMDAVKYAGVYVNCATITEYKTDKTIQIKMVWNDDTHWEYQRVPAMEYIKGTYPKNENEIMISDKAIKQLQIASCDIGSELSFTYKDGYGSHLKTFVVSGICKNYANSPKVFVSKDFYHTTGHKSTDINGGCLCLTFKKPFVTYNEIKTIKTEFSLGKNQELYVDEGKTDFFIKAVSGVVGLSFLVLFSAYLLIHNVIYISISKDIHFFGLLKTIGATEVQIKGIIRKQVRRLSILGISMGIVSGVCFSCLLVPKILGMVDKHLNTQQIVFHPLIFIGTIFFVYVTVSISSHKPAKLAGSISPVEAVKYTDVSMTRQRKKMRKGNRIFLMAKDHLFREKKRTWFVLLSLFTCLTIFVCMVTLVKSQGARNMISSFVDYDVSLSNETFQLEDNKDMKQKFDDSFFHQLLDLDGIQSIHKIYTEYISVPLEPEFSEKWMKAFYERWMRSSYEDNKEKYKKHPEKFGGYLIGIDDLYFEEINKTLTKKIEIEQFHDGKVCIIYQNDLDLKEQDVIGKTISFTFPNQEISNHYEMEIAGLADYSYSSYTGKTPNIMVSDRLAENWLAEPMIETVDVVFQKEYNSILDKQIKTLVKGDTEIGLYSKIDVVQEMQSSQNEMMILGGGLSLVLALIGMLNYINFMINGIQGRLVEFSILEGIGMSKGQIQKMLLLEGIGYGGMTLTLVSTIGIGIVYLIFQATNYMKVDFLIPVRPVAFFYLVMLLLCALTPPVIYHVLEKKTISERMRELE